MHRSQFLLAGLVATAILSVIACSDGTETTGTQVATGPGRLPPKAGDPKPADEKASSLTLAANTLFLGTTDRNGKLNKTNGWKDYGFDLDGKQSTATSSDLCKPQAGADPAKVRLDGNQGIDNAFGKLILPVITAAAPDAETSIKDSLAEGAFTLMLDIEHLGPDNAYNPLVARLYAGSKLDMPPKFDGNDVWPVVPELLTDPNDIKSSKVQFPTSYLINNTWVSGSKGDIKLSLAISGFTISLTIGSAIIAMDLAADHKSATNGTIAGILETEVLVGELTKVVGAFDKTFCEPNATVDSILTQIRQASDIMHDGSQDPSKTCDGISIGLGFNMAQVKLGPVGSPAEQKDPCAGAGGGGSSSSSSSSSGSGSSSSGAGGAGGN